MTAMMQRVVTEGTGRTAMLDRNVAGKTGTTQLPDLPEFKDKAGNQIDGSKDAWFVGYTNELVAAVWVGYPVTNRTHYLTTTGGKMPAAIFKEVMSRALKDSPASVLSPPSGYTFAMGEPKLINANAELTLVQGGKSPNKSVGVAAVSVPTKSPAATAPPASTPANTTVNVIAPELVGASSQPPATPAPGTAANAPAQAVQSPKPETTKPEPTAAKTSTPTPAATKQPRPTPSPATPVPTVKPTSTASPTPVPDNGNSTTVTTEPKATVKPEADNNMKKSAKKQNR
jgi:penicillin-binding protein 2A